MLPAKCAIVAPNNTEDLYCQSHSRWYRYTSIGAMHAHLQVTNLPDESMQIEILYRAMQTESTCTDERIRRKRFNSTGQARREKQSTAQQCTSEFTYTKLV